VVPRPDSSWYSADDPYNFLYLVDHGAISR
jgi:hypothetical protein